MKQMQLLTVREVAQSLSLEPRTIARWCREGQFREARKVGRVWRIPVDDQYLQTMVGQMGYGDDGA